jgi:hypothetical protein
MYDILGIHKSTSYLALRGAVLRAHVNVEKRNDVDALESFDWIRRGRSI